MCKSLTTVVFVAFLASVGFFADAGSAHAQFTPCSSASLPSGSDTTTCSGSATKYLISLLAFKLRPSSGDDHILVSSSQPCDVGSVSPGGEVCVFGSNLTIPANTYTGFVLEINRTFTASGSTTLPAACTATNASTTVDIPTDGGSLTFTDIGSNNMRIVNTLSSITLAQTIIIDFTITFDAGAGVLYTFNSSGACTNTAAGPLSMSMSFVCKSATGCPSGP